MIEKAEEIRKTLKLDGTARPSYRRWMAVSLIAAAFLIACSVFAGDHETRQYRTAEAHHGDLLITVTATGTLQSTTQVDVGSEVSGIITKVAVNYNDHVKIGQLLATFDTQKLAAQVSLSEANLKAAAAKVAECEVTASETEKYFNQDTALLHKAAISQKDFQTVEANFRRAQADLMNAEALVTVAQANLALDRTTLSKADIVSPINGIVLQRDVQTGQTFATTLSSPVLFTLAENLTQMQLQVDVDEADVGTLKEGQDASFTVAAYPDRHFPATVTQVRFSPKTVDGVVTYETVLSVDNSELLLRPGMTATAEIIVKKAKDALLIPNAALRFVPIAAELPPDENTGFLSKLVPHPPSRPSKPSAEDTAGPKKNKVWVLRDQNAVAVRVEVGGTDGRMTEVVTGDIKPGMQLITDETEAGG